MVNICTVHCCCVFSAKLSTMSVKLLCGLLGVLMMSQLVMSDDDDIKLVFDIHTFDICNTLMRAALGMI